MTTTKTNELLAKTLGKKRKAATKIIKIDDAEFEMRKPSMAERREIGNLCEKMPDGDNDLDSLAIWGIIRLTYHPGTDERVFDDAHYNEFLEFPVDEDFIMELGKGFWDFCWYIPLPEEQDDQKKS